MIGNEWKGLGRLVPLAGLLLCMGFECSEEPAGFTPPDDAVTVGGPRGVPMVQTRWENPILEGRVEVDLAPMTVASDDLPTSLLYDERVFYAGPVGYEVHVDGGASAPWIDIHRGGLDLEWTFPFRGPGVSLPMGGSPVPVSLWELRRSGDGVLGMQVDSQLLSLHPDVLVVPAHVTIFAPASGEPPYLGGTASVARALVAQLFDPAGAREGPYIFPGEPASGFLALAHRFRRHPQAEPDGLWYQCGIQLHLEEVEVVPQQLELERVLSNSTNPCGPLFEGPLRDYLVRPSSLGAVPIYVGGEINHDLLSTDLGVTCPPGASNQFIGMQGREMLTAGVLAHELGHFFGLDHESAADNLMTPPDSASRSIRGRTLTASQCETARCTAANLLVTFGRMDSSDADTICGVVDPVCGNGIREPGESCDDGNDDLGDGCRPDCTLERCGDGRRDPGEECDYGIASERENCDATCSFCDACNVCGDGMVGPGEGCDDGNDDPNDACANDCTPTLI